MCFVNWIELAQGIVRMWMVGWSQFYEVLVSFRYFTVLCIPRAFTYVVVICPD
jgi:hypothetical protein